VLEPSVDFHQALLAREPRLASVRAQVAQDRLDDGDLEAAIMEASEAIACDPGLVLPWLVRAAAHKARCAFADAVRDFERAVELVPGRAALLINLAHAYVEVGRLSDAEGALRQAVAAAPRNAEALASLGSVLVRQEKFPEAEAPCRDALALDPGMVRAHQNLAGILAASDPAAARRHRDAAYGRQQVFVEPAPRPELTVLVLTAADAGNVPLHHLIARERVTLVRWYVEYATEDQDCALPDFDVVFNAIGEADLLPDIRPPVVRILQAGQILNHPANIALTGRVALPRRLAGIDGVVVPSVVRYDGARSDVVRSLARSGITFPVLLRPLGAHGGEGVRRIDDAAAMQGVPDDAYYLTKFVDFASTDGWYRKYRMIFVEGLPYPYHLAISPHWLVHYWRSGMEDDATRRKEEQRFLADPEAALGAPAMAALHAIGQCLGLDYGGADFSLLPDGRVLVFEANATMLVHPEADARFAYRNPAVAAIRAAFGTMLKRVISSQGGTVDPVNV
jgi:Flp pilus assembly protein TadD